MAVNNQNSHERGHEFLNLEDQVKKESVKQYKFDHKKIQEIRDRELRDLARRNQYQLAELKKDEE